MFSHNCKYIIADGIVTGSQNHGTVIAGSYIPGDIRYLNLKRKTGALGQYQSLARKRCKDAVLRIARRPCRTARAGFAPWPHGPGGSLGTLGARDSLGTGFALLARASRRTGLAPRPHGPHLPAPPESIRLPGHFCRLCLSCRIRGRPLRCSYIGNYPGRRHLAPYTGKHPALLHPTRSCSLRRSASHFDSCPCETSPFRTASAG